MVRGVRVSRKELKPTLHARVASAGFGEMLQTLVVREDAEGGASKVATKRLMAHTIATVSSREGFNGALNLTWIDY